MHKLHKSALHESLITNLLYLLLFTDHYFSLSFNRQLLQSVTQQQTYAHSLHQHSAFGAGERIRIQHVLVQTQAHWDRHLPEPLRETGENLVPEQKSKAQEGRKGQLTQEQSPQLQMFNLLIHKVSGGWGRGRPGPVTFIVRKGRQRPFPKPITY